MNFNTIPEALEDLRQGKIILVTDDPDRENEGDFICAAEFATTENINFMATHGKGLICMPMSEAFVRKLQFPQMVQNNTDNHETAFTVSIDHISTSTGISAAERSVTAMACVEEGARAEDFRRPGHMFPLLSKKNGVLEREGHTEATVDLCRLAGLKECGLCCEIMREDGTMMRTAELMTLAERFGIKFITIRDLQAYRKCHEKLVDQVTAVNMGVKSGNRLIKKQHFLCGAQRAGKQHPLLLPAGQLPIASPCEPGDLHLIHSLRCKLLFFFVIKRTAAAASLAPGENDLSHGCREVLLYHCLLRQIADLVFSQPVARQNSAADGRLQAEDRFHKGTLAGAVFPYDAEIVACQELKAEVLENGSSIVAGTEILTSELSHRPTSLP